MCNFFSAVSDGFGKVMFFKVEDVCGEMAKGNPKNYEWNSHSSISKFHGVEPKDEHLLNFWEYDVDKKTIRIDRTGHKTENELDVKKIIEDYLSGKDVVYIRNLYNWNSGNSNSGNWNSGDSNSGNWNSGNRNSGNWNSGDSNSGDSNSGNWNSGDSNSGNWNSGDSNSGDSNSGDSNSGNWNSGNWNSGNGVINDFCTKKLYILFNKPCKENDIMKAHEIMNKYNFCLTEWINSSDMSAEEKTSFPYHEITGGYLKTYTYKEAWAKSLKDITKDQIKEIKTIKNFSSKLFKEITGVKI